MSDDSFWLVEPSTVQLALNPILYDYAGNEFRWIMFTSGEEHLLRLIYRSMRARYWTSVPRPAAPCSVCPDRYEMGQTCPTLLQRATRVFLSEAPDATNLQKFHEACRVNNSAPVVVSFHARPGAFEAVRFGSGPPMRRCAHRARWAVYVSPFVDGDLSCARVLVELSLSFPPETLCEVLEVLLLIGSRRMPRACAIQALISYLDLYEGGPPQPVPPPALESRPAVVVEKKVAAVETAASTTSTTTTTSTTPLVPPSTPTPSAKDDKSDDDDSDMDEEELHALIRRSYELAWGDSLGTPRTSPVGSGFLD